MCLLLRKKKKKERTVGKAARAPLDLAHTHVEVRQNVSELMIQITMIFVMFELGLWMHLLENIHYC